MGQQYRSREGDTVDYIAWRYYGTQSGQVVEALLNANRGLSDLGAVLPAGTVVQLPDIAEPEKVEGVRLWD